MKLRKPDYYDRFQCIAGACRDSCCIGWEIDVDEEKRELYRTTAGELGERLKRDIDWEEGCFILQGKEERCPFLNQENLCDLILGLGEESLCDICREHPRFYEWYEDLTEAGIGLCCEEAARLILESETPAGFILEDDSDEGERYEKEDDSDEEENIDMMFDAEADDLEESDMTDFELSVLFKARETAYIILQNRELSIWERLRIFLAYVVELQGGLDFSNYEEIEESAEFYKTLDSLDTDPSLAMAFGHSPCIKANAFQYIVELCGRLEPIDESWTKKLQELTEFLQDYNRFDEIEQEMLSHSSDHEYENLAVYFVYRYFMKCRNDGNIFSKGMLAVFCLLVIRMLDAQSFAQKGSLSTKDRAWNAKDCSKEIEYSEENLQLLEKLLWRKRTASEAIEAILLYKCREKVHNKE